MKFDVYQGSSGVWSWRMMTDGDVAISESAKSYKTRGQAIKALRSVAGSMKAVSGVKVHPLNEEPEDLDLAAPAEKDEED